jgi:hypothetical protein
VTSYLERNVRAHDQVWLYPNDSALPLEQAGLRLRTKGVPGDYPAVGFKGLIRAGSPAVVSLTDAQAKALAATAGKDRAPVIWLVMRQAGIFDPHEDLPRALADQRRAGAIQQWGYVNIRPYYRR